MSRELHAMEYEQLVQAEKAAAAKAKRETSMAIKLRVRKVALVLKGVSRLRVWCSDTRKNSNPRAYPLPKYLDCWYLFR